MAPPLPIGGFPAAALPTPAIDALSDDELTRLNQLLPWRCFTVDGRGRRLGSRAWAGKREEPQAIPDRRITLLDTRTALSGRKVLEIGCFEGVHTIALAAAGAQVIAVDARVENVVKTIVRANLFGYSPQVRVCNVESARALSAIGRVDVVHHVGVLYHLVDPVAHLEALAPLVSDTLMLDTHVARPNETIGHYVSSGKSFAYFNLMEGGPDEVFSGMGDHAKWLLEEDLVLLLRRLDFDHIEITERRDERNGLRLLLFARKAQGAAPR